MKEFRIIIGQLVTEWMNADDWSVEDMNQWLEFGAYNIEYR